jgi:hypothetical protein
VLRVGGTNPDDLLIKGRVVHSNGLTIRVKLRYKN